MMVLLQSLLAFVAALGLLVTFHEFGHYWVARRFDVKILRFSVGFGRPLWKRLVGRDNTEFVVAALPLGGYVKMLDEREGEVGEDERGRAFNNKPLGQRAAIVLAGPVFNFFFAILAYWAMFMIGVDGLKPVVGKVDAPSIAKSAGFQANDRILRVDETPTPTWTTVFDVLMGRVVAGRESVFLVADESQVQRELRLDLSRISVDELAAGQLLSKLGIDLKRPRIPAVIGGLTDDGAARQAGLQVGDQILAADGVPLGGWIEWVRFIQARPGQTLSIRLLRAGKELTLSLRPALFTDEQGRRIGRIGAAVDQDYAPDAALLGRESYPPLAAFIKALVKTWDMSLLTLRILGKMITGEASVKNLSGPISIAQYAGQSAGLGLVTFLGFLAIVSISLGILNLLPIPLLDGGHLMYYLVEFASGRPVPESAQLVGQQIGLGVLFGLMSLAFYNDILRVLG